MSKYLLFVWHSFELIRNIIFTDNVINQDIRSDHHITNNNNPQF
jgi:hypothetical protein